MCVKYMLYGRERNFRDLSTLCLIYFPYLLMCEVLITNWSLILNSVNIQKVLSVMKPGLFSEAIYSFWI